MKIEILGTRNTAKFINMLAWIELLGNVGHSADFNVCVDGDGGARFKFKFDTEKDQEAYDNLRKALCNEFINQNKDIEVFSFE